MSLIRNFLGMIRFSHTIFALPFALLSALLAWQDTPFRWQHLLGIVLCMVFARSAAMAFNRLVDRNIDARNPRTANRHLVTGALKVRTVSVFVAGSSIAFMLSTLLFVPNYWPLGLSFPVLVFLAAYSYTKRITSFAHFWLGASLLLAPLAAWIAIRGPYQLVSPLLLGGAVMFWVAGFDILYATQDAEFDRVSKLHSIPARFGVARSLRIAAACHIVMWLLLAMLTYASPHLGAIFASGLIVLAAMLIYQHVLVRPDDLTRVNRAFFQVNAVISIGMLVLAIAQLWIGN